MAVRPRDPSAVRVPRWTILTALLLVAMGADHSPAQIPLGAEFRVDTNAAHPGYADSVPGAVAIAADGRFVVVWFEPSGSDVFARRFSAAGRPEGPGFLVNVYTTGRQDKEKVAVGNDGSFVVVWTSHDQDGSGAGVFARRFDSSGTPTGIEFRVHQQTAGSQSDAGLAIAPNGDFVAVWTNTPPIGPAAIVGARFASSGAPIGGEFQVSTTTTEGVGSPSIDFAGNGDFVVVWAAVDGPSFNAKARLFDASGAPRGAEFVVNNTSPYVNARVFHPTAARGRDGTFVASWYNGVDIRARRFDSDGTAAGPEFTVNLAAPIPRRPAIDVDHDGDFIVAWQGEQLDGDADGVAARRYDRDGNGASQLVVNTYTTASQGYVSVGSDPAGNFIVVWHSFAASPPQLRAQRYAAGLMGIGLSVDPTPGQGSDGNGVLEAGETAGVVPSWLNANFGAQIFAGTATAFTGPGTPGDPSYTITDAVADYGMVPSGGTVSCAAEANCCAVRITIPTLRPAAHWDAVVREEITPANLGGLRNWTLHVGDSFSDVVRASPFYRFVEALLHNSVTGGCSAGAYCPVAATTREQMAVFVLVSKEGASYAPPACGTPMFADVPATSPFCRWIEELARRGVVAGCGGGNYCPSSPVTREQMAVFVLRTLDPALTPPACVPPNQYDDVPETSPFCRWIEELTTRGVVTGCGGGNYCPAANVTREQMGVFLAVTFGLALYGP